MELVRKPQVSLYVIRSSRHWVVRDPDGNFWLVPSAENAWAQRQPFCPDDDSGLEPVPGHYLGLLDLPF